LKNVARALSGEGGEVVPKRGRDEQTSCERKNIGRGKIGKSSLEKYERFRPKKGIPKL